MKRTFLYVYTNGIFVLMIILFACILSYVHFLLQKHNYDPQSIPRHRFILHEFILKVVILFLASRSKQERKEIMLIHKELVEHLVHVPIIARNFLVTCDYHAYCFFINIFLVFPQKKKKIFLVCL